MNSAFKLMVAMLTILAAVGLAVISSNSPGFASNLEIAGIYSASLAGDAEIPKVNTDATGEALLESNAQAAALGDSAATASSGSDISYKIDVQNIEEISSAHIHMGRSDENGPIIASIFKPQTPTGKINGELVNGTLSAENLEGPLVGKQISELLDLFDRGEAYVNIHTAANPDGEIRGIIQQG